MGDKHCTSPYICTSCKLTSFHKNRGNARECRQPFTTFSRLDLIANRYLDTVERQEHVAPKHISGIYQILTSTSTNYSNVVGTLDGDL